MNIIDLQAGHVPEAAILIRELRSDMNGQVVCTAREVEEALQAALEEPTYKAYVAYDEEEGVLGYIGVNHRFAIYSSGAFRQVTELFVTPEYRRRGIASALMDAAEEDARKVGDTIELGAPSLQGHDDAHHFYRARGYKIVGPRMSRGLT
ncbi:MAG: GNAT family N-acetyltransferase [Roseibium sp.]|uniref:GNAT family N-acetyltransferase n=1 Tax=Roseibium sp. TaxID=1936156 RepID=UPI00329A6A10